MQYADLEQYFNLLSPIAIGVFSFIARQISKKMEAFDVLEKKVDTLSLTLADLREDLTKDITDLKQAQTLVMTTMSKVDSLVKGLAEQTFEMKATRDSLSEVVILRRDLSSAWQDIDAVRALALEHEERIKVLRDRSHWANNKLMILKIKAEKAGWEFKDEWSIPQ